MSVVLDWDTDEDLRFAVKTSRDKNVYGNYKHSTGKPDFRKGHSVIIKRKDIPDDALKYPDDWIRYCKYVVEEYFDGTEGTYYVLGRQQDKSKHSRMLFNVPVFQFNYANEEIEVLVKHSRREPYGKRKTPRRLYRAFKVMPELRHFVA